MFWILDSGHNKSTPGKRSPVYDGRVLREYEFTRDIVRQLAGLLKWAGIEHHILVKPEEDKVSLHERVRRANAWGDRDAVYVSVHANAGGGHGYEVYTSPGQTRSDAIATRFLESFATVFPEATPRLDISDGDPDKEAEFYVLVKTTMPAILTESFFMDTESDCRRYLMEPEGRRLIALAHYMAIANIEKRGV
jgi:N-acetylmuramoyl-L-alanine amidase